MAGRSSGTGVSGVAAPRRFIATREWPPGVEPRFLVIRQMVGLGASRPLPRVATMVCFLINRAGAQPQRQELVFMPLSRPSRPCQRMVGPIGNEHPTGHLPRYAARERWRAS
jgi:hypothetical protein